MNKDLIRSSIEALKYQKEHPHRLTKTSFPQQAVSGVMSNDKMNKTTINETAEQIVFIEEVGESTSGRRTTHNRSVDYGNSVSNEYCDQ